MSSRSLCSPAALLPLLLIGCLQNDPESPGYSAALRPHGARIASVEDDEVLLQRIGNNDGVDALVPLHTGFAGGQEVLYWDLGKASSRATPVYLFRKHGAHGAAVEIDHPELIDSAPGDTNYSPLRVLYQVFVTDAYDGERITSVQALEDAIELGLLEEPEALGLAVNWPVVLKDTQLEVGAGAEPLTPTPVYYKGRVATQLRIGGTTEGVGAFPIERGMVMTSTAYVLRRQNEQGALDETARMEDLNVDGDTMDSNVVFAVNAGDMGYASLWQEVDVTVPTDYAFGDSRAEADLFERQAWGLSANPDAVVSFTQVTDTLLNRPFLFAP
jgi:hypothetical protein